MASEVIKNNEEVIDKIFEVLQHIIMAEIKDKEDKENAA